MELKRRPLPRPRPIPTFCIPQRRYWHSWLEDTYLWETRHTRHCHDLSDPLLGRSISVPTNRAQDATKTSTLSGGDESSTDLSAQPSGASEEGPHPGNWQLEQELGSSVKDPDFLPPWQGILIEDPYGLLDTADHTLGTRTGLPESCWSGLPSDRSDSFFGWGAESLPTYPSWTKLGKVCKQPTSIPGRYGRDGHAVSSKEADPPLPRGEVLWIDT